MAHLCVNDAFYCTIHTQVGVQKKRECKGKGQSVKKTTVPNARVPTCRSGVRGGWSTSGRPARTKPTQPCRRCRRDTGQAGGRCGPARPSPTGTPPCPRTACGTRRYPSAEWRAHPASSGRWRGCRPSASACRWCCRRRTHASGHRGATGQPL